MITKVRTALNTLLKTATGISASNLYFNDAPPRAVQPYCIFSFTANAVDRDTATEFNDIFIQIDLFGKTLKTVETLEAALKTVLDGVSLSLTLHNSAPLFRISGGVTRKDMSEAGNYWRVVMEYKLMLDEK